ncbi:MAG: YkvA family protein [Negativicoccus succinicivorans]|uniref:YkvA family protein n=1 Tax=Negativicoccus succinicivorans TaxID=620903 RepID=UPI0029128650|nr:YkvA family protein [Negativicoccus succinicivorans]MDU5915220.1 YkvA family protein [Negativicoccus succinicivorans]
MGRLFKLLFRAYSAKKFLGYFGTLGKRAGFLRQAVVLFYCLRDSRTPNFVRLAILGALGYMITPGDLLPDFIAGIGWLDDAAVVAGAMKIADKYIRPEHVIKAKKFFPG